MQKKNELYEVTTKKREVKIIFINPLSCVLWGKNWGLISNYFQTKNFLNECDGITIDFVKCHWADPIALLSILLELVRIKYDRGKKIRIILPRLGVNDDKNISYKKGQFLKFLATQGFMKLMIDNFNVCDNKEKLTNNKTEKYANYNYQLKYDGAEIVQAKIYNIEKYSRDEILNQVEEEFLFRLKNTVSLQTYYMLEGQVYNILTELIENVEKHAYQRDEKKRFGLYIRKRYGAVKNYGKDKKGGVNSYSEILQREKANCPALDNQVLLDNEAIIEIFFVDIGIGMKGSLQEYYKSELRREYTYPIRELFRKVLKDGLRKNNEDSLTPYGGLHFICRILRENNGYIWCNEGKEWVGSLSNNLLKNDGDAIEVGVTSNSDAIENKGLAWCFRIPYNDTSKRRNAIAYIWENKANLHPVFRTLQTLDRSLEINRVICIDSRYDKCTLMDGNVIDWRAIQKKRGEYDITGKADSYVWFPKPHYSKNEIIAELKEVISNYIIPNSTALEDVNIIVGEIDSNELISFYYALNNISLEILEMSNIVKIILVTKMWEVVCFENKNNNLWNNSDISRSFFEYNISNSVKIHDYIGEYARFLRKYDSYLFWHYIKGHQDQKVFINADIMWSNQMVIKGYLDFDQVYLCEELYLLLKNSLLRTSGFVNNAEVEYRNIDYASLRVCQDTNSNNIYSDSKGTVVINVGGACATGYTRESFYKENRVDINIIFFPHECFKKSLQDTAFLFVWPEASFFSDFPGEKNQYYRLGKTNLITHDSAELLIDVEEVYRSTVRDKKETYRDFQQRYPRFIKYGHYKTDKHHYLIGFDLITYIKYSAIKKEGAFVFILWKIINYLAGDAKEKYTDLKDKEWEKVLANYRNHGSVENGELVVYHSNTFTEYIVKLLKDILPKSLAVKLIPINIIEIQPKGTPVTFSPFTLNTLKSYFCNENKNGILYMDSSFSTGRKMIEIENVLLSSGCKKVSFLSVLDMRRLRNVDFKNSAYWKVNIPRLDDDSHCIFCNTLKIIESFSKKVDSVMAVRIQEWIVNWKCLSIVNTVSGHGIENISGMQYSLDGINICDANALNIYIAEKLCESYSNDYVYKFISGKTDLTINLKLQLICTQLCLYGNQNSRQLQLSLLSELVGNMAKNEEVSSYTSLAGLILISQPDTLIYELLNEILYENTNAKILSIKKFMLHSKNMDLIITLAYFVKNSYMVEQLLNGYEKAYSGEYEVISSINAYLLPERDLKLLSKEMAGLIVNEQGRRHNTNIQKLLSDHATDIKIFREKCQRVKNDFNRLYELSKHFPIALANSRTVSNARRDIKLDIEQVELMMQQDEEKYEMEEREGRKVQRADISDELRDAIVKCKTRFEEILDGYFISYSDEIVQYFCGIIKEYEKKYSKVIKVNVTNNVLLKEIHKWYYWNRGIETEFKYLVENIVHCVKDVEDENVKMSIDIKFEFNYIMIIFKSWSEITADVVKNAFLSKNRLSKEQSMAFDVIFDFENELQNDEGEFLLVSKMSVPACFQQLKGDQL